MSNKYPKPHQGQQEIERRRKQILRGQLTESNALARTIRFNDTDPKEIYKANLRDWYINNREHVRAQQHEYYMSKKAKA